MVVASETELKNCSLVKIALMLLIVLYHSLALWLPDGWFNQEPYDPAPLLGEIAAWLNSFHIYAFTLVSGYIFCYVSFERGGGV